MGKGAGMEPAVNFLHLGMSVSAYSIRKSVQKFMRGIQTHIRPAIRLLRAKF
jgi:hypothetical protein